MIRLTAILGNVLCLLSGHLLAQSVKCVTPPISQSHAQEIAYYQTAMFQLKQARLANATVTYVPIRPHITRRSDGSGGYDLADLNQIMATTNSRYLQNGMGIQFYFAGETPDYIDNTQLYENFNEANLANGRDATNALNQYYVNSNTKGLNGSYAYYPADYIQATRSVLVVESGKFVGELGNSTFPHELGHNFGLIHTHGDNNPKELVTREANANCTFAGDYICDTPADPYGQQGVKTIYINGCTYYDTTCTARDASGKQYRPATDNTMSYYYNSETCLQRFTPGQYERIQASYALRQSHKTYSLDAPPTTVLPVTNVVANYINRTVSITWQDNASNEMGYFIERARTNQGYFEPVGGVKPGIITFTDRNVEVNVAYTYRIRPSNTTTESLSNSSYVYTGSCTSMYTLKPGSWNDPSVWSCGRLPTATDQLLVNHVIVLPTNYVATARTVTYKGVTGIIWHSGSQLQMSK